MDWKEHIITDKEILCGKPVIKSTRLSVELILERLANGWSEQMLFESYPSLYKEGLQAVYAFALDNLEDTAIINAKLMKA